VGVRQSVRGFELLGRITRQHEIITLILRGLCRDRTYDPVIKSRVATFNCVEALLHSLSEPANAFSASHLLYQLSFKENYSTFN
jgi:hypothetical protein